VLTLSGTGAGVGGVATAARLAKAGLKVIVVEKNDFAGGRCSLLHHEGYVSSVVSLEDLTPY
jgi:phytoene dehydrogenase-like protein